MNKDDCSAGKGYTDCTFSLIWVPSKCRGPVPIADSHLKPRVQVPVSPKHVEQLPFWSVLAASGGNRRPQR